MPERADRSAAALRVDDLHVTFRQERRAVSAVDGLSFDVAPGRVLGVVGESGSGKSATALACLGLLPGDAEVTGTIEVAGHDMVTAAETAREALRGNIISMIFQDSLAGLNPYRTIGRQIADAYLLHHHVTRKDAHARAVELLDRVGLSNPRVQADQYPHQLSGGMRQRGAIAIAICNDPQVLIADEPTTALDVTVQAQVLDLLLDLVADASMALVLITHDLGVVAEVADDVVVMYAGRASEQGTVFDIFDRAAHPYTVGLHAATPDLHDPLDRLVAVPGVPASGVNRPSGCPFHPRCYLQPSVGARCLEVVPELSPRPGSSGHVAACFGTQPTTPDGMGTTAPLPALATEVTLP